VVAESDLVAAMPRLFATLHAKRYQVEITEPPMPLMATPIRAIVPQAAMADAGLAWMLGRLEAAAKTALKRR
jgi:hypothetical protein